MLLRIEQNLGDDAVSTLICVGRRRGWISPHSIEILGTILLKREVEKFQREQTQLRKAS